MSLLVISRPLVRKVWFPRERCCHCRGFYATPVIYPLAFVEANALWALPIIKGNSRTWFAELFQALFAVATFAAGYALFHRWSVNFAKEV